jgi:LacI family transcriptional regulator, galactose operon repressor
LGGTDAARDETLVRVADFREEGGSRAMEELLMLRPRPDAVLVTNNRMTAGALRALEAAKVRVPEDLAVVGYDEISWAPCSVRL